ncbi:alpha/beta hydrolase [Nocardioides immobilis]|uniref:alpha/beta hydrolase n=1 Tax=Nocardioides immobilis TaxID=2049295 RepID=UPI0015FC4521|nr:alpha/beta hydrolase [Nocardioides immobilis]
MTQLSDCNVVLVPGAWHGAWAWAKVVARLRALGINTLAMDLPGQGRGDGRHDLEGHADVLQSVVSGLTGRTLVCGHSYGGAVVGEATLRSQGPLRLLFLAAFMLDRGECCMSVNDVAGESASGSDSFEWVDDDHVLIPREAAMEAFYRDVIPDEAQDALDRLTPEHRDTVYGIAQHAGWSQHRSSYVLCGRDRAIVPAVQRKMATRADLAYYLDAGHSAMLSHPELVSAIMVAELLREDLAQTGEHPTQGLPAAVAK